MHRKSGFTLIELLVVIAIIAILAAILFPLFLSAKQKGLQVKCVSNLKQIGLAMTAYLSDTNGRYPPFADKVPTTGNWTGTWFTVLQKYSKTRLLANCPADGQRPGKIAASATGLKLPPGAKLPSYAKNVYLDYWTGSAGMNPTVAPPTESVVVFTRTTAFIMDGPPTPDTEGADTWWGPPTTYPPYTNWKPAIDSEERHAGGANVLFCDWHVRIVRPKEWKSTRLDTAADNPLKGLPFTHIPTGDWGNKNDGSHPWFRPD